MKIQGIRSVDFKVTAQGEGIVNWNGGFSIRNPSADKFVDNHVFPKMRNIDPMRLKSLNSADFEKAQIFVSQNCIRNHLFKNESLNLQTVSTSNVKKVLPSILGLVRGYMIAGKGTGLSLKRKSALLLEDFVAKDSTVRYEQFGNSGERNENSMFSKTEGDNLNYSAYGSISIEDLEFIVLEDSFNRSSYSEIISIEEGKDLANDMTNFLKTLDFEGKKNPAAIFHTNYVRKGGFMNAGEAGLLLNDDAIDLVVTEVLERIKDLFIRQSKGYLRVTELLVDYNTGRAMRIKDNEQSINLHKSDSFAVYYEGEEISEKEFSDRMEVLKSLKKDQKAKAKKQDKKKAAVPEEASLSKEGEVNPEVSVETPAPSTY